MHKLLFFIPLILTLFLYNSAAVAGNSQAEQIQAAKSNFQDLVKNQPDKEILATAYLVNEIALDNVPNLVKGQDLSVVGFRHGNQSYSGGYGIKPGESLEEAMANYQRKHELILTKKTEIDQMNVQSEGDEDLEAAMQAYVNNAKYRLEDFKKHGLRIVGIDLAGKVSTMKNFMNGQTAVRLIEVREENDHLPIIIPNTK